MKPQERKALRERLTKNHKCKAFCRDDEHVEVVWHMSHDIEEMNERCTALCKVLGIKFVRVERASPETRRPDTKAVLCVYGEHIEVESHPVLNDHPYLMAWRAR